MIHTNIYLELIPKNSPTNEIKITHDYHQTQSTHFTNSTEHFIIVIGETNNLEHYLKPHVAQEPPMSMANTAFTPLCH